MTEFENLKIEITDDGIAIVYIDRPPVNAISAKLLEQVYSAIRELQNNKDLRCVILVSANPKGFSAGGDVNDFKDGMPKGANTPYGQSVMNEIEWCSLPVIAAINGYCLGGGLELALACDIRIVAEDAKIGLPEANLGILGAWGGLTRLPWLIGEANAKLLFFTSERISGQRAYELGIAQKCVPVEKLLDEALALAREIAKRAPLSIAGAKRVMFTARNSVFGPSMQTEINQTRICSASEDCKEAMSAFKERRAPQFKNR